ncbi:MAG: sigma 54 modulation/S30EA ribosomal C-terminal domain-containing protein [Acidimicrobiales bacterium]
MPEGVVRWFDESRGDAEILRDGRPYHAPPGALEPGARHPGARVHFDIERVDGVEEAIDVRLRQSAVASRHRHRLGSLAGARRFDTKGPSVVAKAHPELHLAEAHPLQVARSWATAVASGDVAGALALYAPDAIVRTEDGRSIEGSVSLQEWLSEAPALGCGRHANVRGSGGRDDRVVVSWQAEAPGEAGLTLECRIAHGEIVEQQVLERAAPSEVAPGGGAGALALTAWGPVGERAETRAREKVASIIAEHGTPVLFARVKLAWEPDPAQPRRARAEVLLDVNGEPLRVQATAHEMTEAVDVLADRLRHRLEHRARRIEELQRFDGVARPGEWRHGDLPTERPPYFDRPLAERQLVRHKTFAVGELTCDEAIFDMNQLDDDFYLFVDLASGLDSVVERTEESTYRMTRLVPSTAELGPTAEPVELSDTEAPVLSLDEAIERLGSSGERHLFFQDAQTGRGCVLYLRYDGHYGLIVPE